MLELREIPEFRSLCSLPCHPPAGRERLSAAQRLLREDPRRSETQQRDAGEETAGQRPARTSQPGVRKNESGINC